MTSHEIRWIASDPEAFEAFYRDHVVAVERFVVRRVADPHLAADLTADVFVAVVESAPRYRASDGAAVAWLYGIARNIVANHLRRGVRERGAVRRIVGRRLLDDDDIARLHDRIDAAAQARELYAALEDLNDGERAVLELVALDGLSVTAAAAALGIRPVTARVRLHRARTALRARLGTHLTLSLPLEIA